MQQLTENPLLNRLISQEDDKLYITLNGKKFDLEKLAENQANHFTTQTMHEISQAETKEKGLQIFRFVRVSPVKNERDHSIHDNEHNDDYFTTNSELVGTEFDGKILLDAYTAIEDYHYGDQPPYGCQHIFVGVEEESEKNGEYSKEDTINKAVSAIDNALNLPKDIFKNTPLKADCEILATQFSDSRIMGQFKNGKISLSKNLVLDLKSVEKKIIKQLNGEIQDYTIREAKALNVYIHELIHSQTIPNRKLTTFECALREGMTEMLSRMKTQKLTGVTIKTGSYDCLVAYINSLKDNLKDTEILEILKSEKIEIDFSKIVNKDLSNIKNDIIDLYLKKQH